MKIPATCAVCMREERFEKSGLPVLLPGEMHDSGVVFVTCPEGHRSAALYNHRKHEIFFASGAMALFDGYSNEAVSSFATALERLYEFYIRVVCRKRDIPQEICDASWKLVARQSERQFGAFCFLYALETCSKFSLPPSIPEFRNKVLHRGYIPPFEEVYDFAEKIFRKIRSVMAKLRETAEDSIREEVSAEIQHQNAEIPKDMPRSSMAGISMHSADWNESEAFTKWLEAYRGLRNTMESLFPKE